MVCCCRKSFHPGGQETELSVLSVMRFAIPFGLGRKSVGAAAYGETSTSMAIRQWSLGPHSSGSLRARVRIFR